MVPTVMGIRCEALAGPAPDGASITCKFYQFGRIDQGIFGREQSGFFIRYLVLNRLTSLCQFDLRQEVSVDLGGIELFN